MQWKNIVAMLFLVISLPSYVLALEPIKEWVAIYGPENNHGREAYTAVDSLGNVYIAGRGYSSENYDIVTIKYDSKGNQLWVARYDSNGSHDVAFAIAVDKNGNVYVAGSSYNWAAYVVVKYDTNGVQQWVVNTSYGAATALLLDENGNVYVTGTGGATFKYDTNGVNLWAAYSNVTLGDIAIDLQGNTYVTGNNYITIKYDNDGNELWRRMYDGPPSIYNVDIAKSIAIDSFGAIYVTGFSYGINIDGVNYSDYATVKYDTNGNEKWVARYGGPNSYSYATSIAVDSSGNAYVSGHSTLSSGNYDYTTIKYNTDGGILWMVIYNGGGPDMVSSLNIDSSGNVFVAGNSYGITNEDFVTVKYDQYGNEKWVARYDSGYSDLARSMAIDYVGNVYVTGVSNYNDFATIKYSQAISTPAAVIASVQEMVISGEITDSGVADALISSLNNAQRLIKTNTIAAKNILEAVTNKLQAQAGKKVSTDAVEKLIGYLDKIIAGL